MVSDRLPSPYDDIVILRDDGCRRVCAVDVVWEAVEDILRTRENQKTRGQLERLFVRWCAGHKMTKEQFLHEDTRRASNGKSYGLYVFKPFQLRCYGVRLTIDNSICFVITEHDLKKRIKASQAKLNAAAEKAAEIEGRAKHGGGGRG